MAKHRIRRWFQFGVLDLLLLMAIAAVVVLLWRPPRMTTYYEPLAEGTQAGQHWSGNGLGMKFRWCPPGEFKMGEPPDQVDVELTCGFWMGKYEVTQGQYRQVMSTSPSYFPDARGGTASPAGVDADKLPVENVSWNNAVEFCRALTEQEQKAGRLPAGWAYCLPTEAQWEYACRAGTQTLYSFGDDESRIGDFAWYIDNTQNQTHEVGQKLPNAWGLHDMHGNVWEWCRHGATASEENERVSVCEYRGGGLYNDDKECVSAARFWDMPGYRYVNLGFRVALVQSR